MNEETKINATELSDTELDSVTGGSGSVFIVGSAMVKCDKYDDAKVFKNNYYIYGNHPCPFLQEQHPNGGILLSCSNGCKYYHESPMPNYV